MQELLLLFAKALPEEKIMEELISAVDEYKILRSDDSKKTIMMYSMMLLAKEGTQGKDISTVMVDMKKRQAAIDLMETREQ